ncbi:E3 SUMO-protein ligase SIZ1 [Rhynchospora pubera]|uniref:E3 SUMO-protein ligase SIZ1 n=1 Tax=Rhynchospora pubera TaxID=906938 RepID=A0AAV8H0Q1_9POAL|nr:E3 SUMO-protein ligase SIZ1 [Rhynchospora pubera]
MDTITDCQEKLSHFTVRDLQSVLDQIGLPKRGKKQELTDRILAVLIDNKNTSPTRKEEIVGCIDSVLWNIKQRKLATHKRKNAPAMPQITNLVPVSPDFDTPVKTKEGELMFRCICGSSLPLDPIIQCEDSRCRVWMHTGCVIVSDPIDGQFNIPTRFFCEICRIQRADPFWVTVAYPLLPVKLVPSLVASDALSPSLCMERTFILSNLDMKLLQSSEHELQAWSMLMNDKVQFRMHWPIDSDFCINGAKLGVFRRPATLLLGANSRDDGLLIKAYCKEGLNKITLAWNDTRTFCFGIRIAKRRTIDQVLNMIDNNKANEESLQDALTRVCRCIGGNCTKSDSTDSDLEVVDNCITINLRCPISGSRIKVAARFKPCVHMGCFDLYTFVELNQHARKWQCPICLKNYSLENLIIDPYFTKITSMLSRHDEDLAEIEVNLDGSWRLKTTDGLNGSKFPWHSPDDSISEPNMSPNLNLKQIQPELNKPNKYEDSLAPIGYKGLIMDQNVSWTHFGENPNMSVNPSWFQPDPQFHPNFVDLISPPCVEKGGENPNMSIDPVSCSWFQPDPQFHPNFVDLISPPCVKKGSVLRHGRCANIRPLHNVSSNLENVPVGDLGGYMSMQGGTHLDDWISLSLATGIVHPLPDPVNASLSTSHNLSATSSFGLPPNSDILLPYASSNQPNALDLDMLMKYNIFSPPVTPEILKITDPNFQL